MKRPILIAGLALSLISLAPDAPKDEQIGKSFKIPYRLTLTNHYLVRVRLNGKGPFNFLVDTGAPALYVSTETAKKVGLTPAKDDYWTPVERLELEGGAVLNKVKARVEDPFQLVGMNALGLPGASIDGILGFTMLARFRMEFDPTSDRMTWTRIAYEPPDPFVPRGADAGKVPAELQMMNALGPIMKLMALFIGKQPEDILIQQGMLGMELAEESGEISVAGVLADSPAARAGVKTGDTLILIRDQSLKTIAEAHSAMTPVRVGDSVRIAIRRGAEVHNLSIPAAEGF